MTPYRLADEFINRIEIKEVSETGTFKGIASVMGVEDLGGDVIDSGAFRKTLSEHPEVPVLWQHDSREAIGSGTLKEWQGKILIDGQLDMDDPKAQYAFGKMRKKLIRGLSIGFSAIKTAWAEEAGRRIRHIQELRLWEVSIVTFPMMEQALITSVKSVEPDDVRRIVREEFEALAAKIKPPAATRTTEPANSHSGSFAALEAINEMLRSGGKGN